MQPLLRIRGCRQVVPVDQHESNQREELVQAHLNAMAIHLGDLQARMLRLGRIGRAASLSSPA
jgi:hypothetical protein